ISTAGKVKFVLPASTLLVRKFVLVSQEASNINNVTGIIQRNFVNYSIATNQGNYIIISHPSLYNNGSGKNYVDDYRAYRSSAAGGGFNAKIYDIDQLNDQFGFGIKNHPSSVKDFLQFAKAKFTSTPKFVFLIGKGVSYFDYSFVSTSPLIDRLNLIPTFGFPASDVRLASAYNSLVPDIPIGRLSVLTGNEVSNYLVKMKQYEQAQVSTSQTVANKGWMKNVIHLIGGKDNNESDLFKLYMKNYKDIIEDTFYGAKVETFSKISTAAVQLISNRRIDELLNEGVNLVSYFGHSSANTLEFNLNAPEAYNNFGKYPFFNVSGCTAGNNYTGDTLRLHGNMTLSEKYVLANQRGSIGFLASTHLGLPPFLNNYQTELYKEMSQTSYGSAAGEIIKKVIQNLGGANPALDFFTRMNLEEMTLHGDPALKINPHPKPDYVIEDNMVKITPSFISVAENNFTVTINMLNIGKAKKDSIVLEIKHVYPTGGSQVIYRKKMNAFYYADSVKLTFPIIATRDKGLNKLIITIDADNAVDEMSESNNTINKDFYIFEDEARPAYPYNFAIINIQNQKLYASTANPFSPAKSYTMEIDTTELFNSTLKVSKTITAAGGILEFDPGINYTDSTVYYWRVAVQPASGSAFRWNTFSFIYLKNSIPGFNQSQYYQHLKSDTVSITLTANRKWKYSTVLNTLFANNGVFPTGGATADDFTVKVNGADVTRSVCGISNIIINVLDPVSLKPWKNTVGGPGLYGSDPICGFDRIANFQYNILDINKRQKAIAFLDLIPDSAVVIIRNTSGTAYASNTYASDWLADTATFGSGNSLYHRLKSQGFAQVDSFNRPRAFIFMYQKNITGFTPKSILSEGILDKISITSGYSTPDTLGIITSPKFGPAKAWKQLHWGGSSEEVNSQDNPIIDIIGIDYNNSATTLLSVNKNAKDVDISSINAGAYPFLQLKMRNMDSVTLTPYQLSFWRVNYDPAPEGAIAPNLFFISKDTLQLGDKLKFGIAFKNISPQAFDSLLVKVIVIDRNNTSHIITVPKQKPLVSGDTVTLKFDIDTNGYAGLNTLYVDFNPDNNQPEQYHFNNFLYKDFFVNSDKTNPLLDVTFDGIHILNRDIVSARPHILIKLKDESKTLALSDTSLLKVQIRFPDGTLKTYKFDNDTLKFTPANLANGENTATIDFTPLLKGQDDEYELIVTGKDASGNRAGETEFHVIFRVINKPMISNLLNYPNPFTTSTAFVFTVTGTQPPQNMRIQILTITGKVVREITSNELGPIRIGRNITEFKWDGTDMYGQKLGNGVYLYRVLTNLNGKSLDKFRDQDDNTDKFFTNGYGKMYFLNSTKY
ncbi:MAG TPA: C25 family cysteine peptidase, partial [Chitinophagaceae bacterium]|nr:C25 family cysteine peptidase [Chitinophagaceae bacterium]